MQQCEWYFVSVNMETGEKAEGLFTCVNGSYAQNEANRCPGVSVDYIICPSGQKVFLCAEHYDIILGEGLIGAYSGGDRTRVPFTQ